MHRSYSKMVASAAAVLVGLALVPLPSLAQDMALLLTARADASPVEEAETAFEMATTLHDSPDHWLQASELYAESARLRPADDPRSLYSGLMSGRILVHLGQLDQAVAMFEETGDRALSAGDVMGAATAYLDVAFCAQREGHFDLSRRFGEKVRLLASSPLLSESQRSWILVRISDEPPGSSKSDPAKPNNGRG